MQESEDSFFQRKNLAFLPACIPAGSLLQLQQRNVSNEAQAKRFFVPTLSVSYFKLVQDLENSVYYLTALILVPTSHSV